MADVLIRRAIPADAGACAEVMFAAFESLATRHAFPIEPETPEFTGVQMESMLVTDGIYGLVAEQDGNVVGSAFADERGRIVGIGPVTVAPGVQGGGVGRTLMESLLHRSAERDVAGVRLVQTAYNYRSLSLYAKLGFAVREPLSVFQGPPPRRSRPAATSASPPARTSRCATTYVSGYTATTATANYATGSTPAWHKWSSAGARSPGMRRVAATSHAVGDTDEDVIALLAGAELIVGLGVLVPSRNTRLMAWCLHSGLQLVQQSTLMTIGLYNEPRGSWLPSVGY